MVVVWGWFRVGGVSWWLRFLGWGVWLGVGEWPCVSVRALGLGWGSFLLCRMVASGSVECIRYGMLRGPVLVVLGARVGRVCRGGFGLAVLVPLLV